MHPKHQVAHLCEQHAVARGQFGVIFKAGALEVLDGLSIPARELFSDWIPIDGERLGIGFIEPEEIPAYVVPGFAEVS